MPKFSFVKGEEDLILHIFIQNSSLTTGLGLAGLDQNSSIAGSYVKRNGTGVAVAVDEDVSAEGTYQAPSTAAHIRIGKPANSINGRYELHIHNDLLTTADYVTIDLVGATNMPPLLIEIQLTNFNLNDASPQVTVLDFVANAITAASINANAITAAKIAAAAIDNATFANDVGSTAYATNIMALALRKALDEIKLDHLIAIADGDDPVDNSIISKLADSGVTADWSAFVNTTDSLRAIKDFVAPANEYDTQLDANISTRAPANEYDTEMGRIDDSITSRAPSGEYDTQLDANMSSRGTADPGDAMNLAADAIKKVSYDESTAFPIESADSGVSKVARTGADSDTLETISDEVAAIPTTAMRGTDNGPTLTEMTAEHDVLEGEHVAINTNVNANETKIDTLITRIGTPANIDSGGANISANLKKLADDNGGADFDAGTDSLQEIRDRGDAAWITGGGGGSGSNVTHIVGATLTNLGGQNFELFFNNGNALTTKTVDDVGVAGSGFNPDTHDLGDGLMMTDAIRKTASILFGNNVLSTDDALTCKDYGGSTTELVLKKTGASVERTTG